jgi:hypothetical protein
MPSGQALFSFSFQTGNWTWLSGTSSASSVLPPVGVLTVNGPSSVRMDHNIIIDRVSTCAHFSHIVIILIYRMIFDSRIVYGCSVAISEDH